MKKNLYLILLSCFISMQLVGQQRKNGHLPAAKTKAEYQLMIDERKNNETSLGKADPFPTDIRMPGEFEESKAVAISWSYEYDDNWDIIGIDTITTYGWISAQLAHYISEESEVWIRLWEATDSIKVLTYMNSLGWPLRNYKFIYQKGDDFWVRDFGPMGFYYGSKDSVGFTDMKYYPGRNLDNVFPSVLAKQMGYKNFVTTLNGEGGNFMTDGYGRMFFSSMLALNNKDALNWTTAKTYSTITSTMGTPDLQDLPTLNCDGGTGHIDLYTKLVDEETILVSKYPDEITSGDKQIIEDNYQRMAGLKSIYNRPYTIFRIPHPTNDNGKHDSVTCNQLNNDARNFVNGLTVNNTFIFPSYSDEISGNKAQTDSVIDLFKSIMPGYRIIPIDSRDMSPLGGAVHCITMQIPADNPLRIWHPKVLVNKIFQNNFRIIAKAQNNSGIKTVKCIWRKNGGEWQTLNLTDSSGYQIGILTVPGLTENDEVDYFIEAEANNGKKAKKPGITPSNYWSSYKIQFAHGTGLEEFIIKPKNYLFSAYPNPANTELHIPFQILNNALVTIKITDVTGKIVLEKSGMNNEGQQKSVFNIESLNDGLYFYTLIVNGETLSTRKFIKN